jgi:hypothetical protein
MTNRFPQSATMAETMLCLAPASRKPLARRKRLMAPAIAALTCLSLMLGATSPAFSRDRDDDLAKALAAAIVLGLIVNHANKKKRHDPPAPAPEPVRAPRVPAVCAIEIDGNHRSVTVYPESCLRDEGFDYRLPRNCAKTARVYGRPDRIYGVQCLRSAGFRVSGY